MRLDVVIFDMLSSLQAFCFGYLALIRVAQPQGVLRGHNTLQLGPVRSAGARPVFSDLHHALFRLTVLRHGVGRRDEFVTKGLL